MDYGFRFQSVGAFLCGIRHTRPRDNSTVWPSVRAGAAMSTTRPDALDRRGVMWGLVAVAVSVVLVVLGSAGLRWFDAALVGYLFGTLLAIFGVTYRYAVWLR